MPVKISSLLTGCFFCLFLLVDVAAAQSETQPLSGVVLEGSHNPNALSPLPLQKAQKDWVSLPDALEPRVEGHSAVLNGKIYVFGGFQTENIVPTDKNEFYDLAAGTWSTFAPLPVPNTHVGSAEVDGKVWIAGGFALFGYIQTADLVWIYDPVANSFSNGPSLPAPRAAGTLVRLGRKLHYISGLINRNDSVGDHFVLDLDEPGGPKTWTSLAPLPDPRNHLSSIAVGGKIYAIGGQFNHDTNPQDTNLLHAYDPETDSWARLADLPYIRSHFEPGTIAVDGKIIIAGGRTGTQNCVNTITQYDPAADAWSELFTMPDCLLAPSAKVIGEEMYISHGGKVSVLFPTTAARKTDFARTPSTILSFSPAVHPLTLDPDETATLESLLWTLSDEADYTIDIAGKPAWITGVSKSSGTAGIAADEIDVTLNTAGLTPGLYSHTFTATADGYDDASLTIELTVAGEQEPVLQSLEAGWNLVSLPVTPANTDASSIFVDAPLAQAPFAYEENGYVESTTMSLGRGYWVNVLSEGVQAHLGASAESIDVDLDAGWNLIGGPSCPAALSDATGDAGVIRGNVAFGFTSGSGYTPEAVLQPGRGYWVKTSDPGTVTLHCGTGKN